ncbi:MAG: KpsF/GutQ family sugar-phosphate isomerase [Proteobacteria bacterium]|nr:KpsF/GutQ family sugar-phosphate isomerase [Pseudomonadota bacterium]
MQSIVLAEQNKNSDPIFCRTLEAEHSQTSVLDICREAILSESMALQTFANNLNFGFLKALALIQNAEGPLIVSGIGKSGHIARKISSTFTSLCKPSIFLHPSEASHGDLGIIQENSAVLLLSNSGETSELSNLIHYCRIHSIPTIAITSNENSTLARNVQVPIVFGEVEEICPNKLAPTASTTLSLAIGDALAAGLAHLEGITTDDFHRFHPGGKLGTALTRVRELMHTDEKLPIVRPDTPMSEVVVVMSEKSLGVAVIVEGAEIQGVITDGDMRRNVKRLWTSTASEIATTNPVRIPADTLRSEAIELMALKGITACVVENDRGQLLGLLHIHDCLRN